MPDVDDRSLLMSEAALCEVRVIRRQVIVVLGKKLRITGGPYLLSPKRSAPVCR